MHVEKTAETDRIGSVMADAITGHRVGEGNRLMRIWKPV